jgi:hypothetical protein
MMTIFGTIDSCLPSQDQWSNTTKNTAISFFIISIYFQELV